MPRFNSQSKKERITVLINRITRNEEVSKRDLDIVLGRELSKEYKRRWKEELERRDELEVPFEVKEYERKLQVALLAYGKYEQYTPNKPNARNSLVERNKNIKTLGNKADSLFEDALEYLEEIISVDSGLCVWFDRNLDFGFGSHLSIDPVGMPRVITSKSLDNISRNGLKTHFGWLTKNDLKLEMLNELLIIVNNELLTDDEKKDKLAKQEILDAKQSAKLKDLLGRLGKI